MQKYFYLNHVAQVAMQLSCSDTCQIQTSYLITNMCFDSFEKFGK